MPTYVKELMFHGHDVVAAPTSETKQWTENEEIPAEMREEESYDRRVIPTIFKGKLQGRTSKQVFSTTHPFTLPIGMCGGPVLIPRGHFTHMAKEELAKMQFATAPAPSADGAAPVGRKRVSGVSPELSKPHIMRKEVLKTLAAKSTAQDGEAGAVEGEAAEDELAYQPGKADHLVVGLLEGIVPLDHPVEEIRGSPVFVESPDIIT